MSEILIYEVGPRDGIQSLDHFVSKRERVRLIRRLDEAGLRYIEVGSMVNPSRVPNMAHSGEVFRTVKHMNPFFSLLVPNERGVKEGQEVGCTRFNVFISPDSKFNERNYGRTYEDIVARCRKALKGIHRRAVRVYISKSFDCTKEELRQAIHDGMEMGRTIVLCDTAGTATPKQIKERVDFAHSFTNDLALHLHHSPYLMDNVEAGYKAGIRQFDTSIGGIGGCPFVEGSTANLPTEDLVAWCEENGIWCGVTSKSLRPALRVARKMKKPLRRRRVHRKLHDVWVIAMAHPIIGGRR